MSTEAEKLQEFLDSEKRCKGLIDFKFTADVRPDSTAESLATELNAILEAKADDLRSLDERLTRELDEPWEKPQPSDVEEITNYLKTLRHT